MTGFPSRLPVSRIPDSADAPPLRWGIVGTGWIARRFVVALQRRTRQQVIAVGSRTAAGAEEFAGNFGIPRAYGSYDELVSDPDVDVVYIATPHNHHHPCALLSLRAAKHTVVEKPIALNAAQACDIADIAASAGVFCMEAMWTFFLPKFDVINQLLDDGALGDVRTVLADCGERFGPDHRIMRQDLAGGPLLDLGIYPISLAVAALGSPETVVADGQPAPSGVNGQVGAVLTGPVGRQAVVHATLFNHTPTTATVAGPDATLAIGGPFYQPGDFTLTAEDGRQLTYTEPAAGYEGLHFQAAEVARCIGAGLRETPVRPLSDSVVTLAVIDEIRRQIGVRFVEELQPAARGEYVNTTRQRPNG